MTDPVNAAVFQQRLLAWYDRCGRELPWRLSRDPYRIWLSEVMLQQTGVQAVIPYFERFVDQFPDVESLASAPLDAVIELWAGLGYYSRARNLHAAAQKVCEAFQGQFPHSVDALMTLPGVGRSTAGAIRAIAFDRHGVILDGNVRRVLCRLFAWQDDPRSSAAEKQLWQWAAQLTPQQHCHDYAQAIMDFGATLCTPRQPNCVACPMISLCQGYQQGIQDQLPRKRQRKTVPLRQEVAVLVEHNGRFAVRQRPLTGMLAGLWEFPSQSFKQPQSAQQQVNQARILIGNEDQPLQTLGVVRHVYSHFRVDVTTFYLQADVPLAESFSSCRWLTEAELTDWPLHGSHKKIVEMLLKQREK
ncbi:A/G-specific adenine glycosylase [uncultured Desulfuromonas sp.]|uniref:A/G-specific adenine glycosylase n=1 Tax=uncultured Desulfuromonas sp. TaxID=181013 RepID=UPI002AAB91A8|nr:A/G-specific adenine glycosylase [uncultured Desulfuromonas sp.]